LLQTAEELRGRLLSMSFDTDQIASAFALAREAARRHTGMRHFHVQLLGGAAMMKGTIAEMQTGEGKSLTALLPAVSAALMGRPVHIITVNDYLARRRAVSFRVQCTWSRRRSRRAWAESSGPAACLRLRCHLLHQ
jgi:preprotein translocase subunit SecA